MRVTLIHNPTAGPASSGPELTELLRAAGYEVRYQSAATDEFLTALDEPGDLVLVAGGDGTVAKVARRLGRHHVPLAVVPLGNSNNIATALGVRGPPEAIVAGLANADRRRLDIGTVLAPWGAARFIESAGVGIFAALLGDRAEPAPSPGGTSGEEKNRLGVRRLRHRLARCRARRLTVIADGDDWTDEYLMVLVLNIGCVGPRLWFAPEGDPGDGRLDLLLVRETNREELDRFLDGHLTDRIEPLGIAPRPTALVRIDWNQDDGHLDDDIWPGTGVRVKGGRRRAPPTVKLAVPDPPIEVLVPQV